MSELLLKSSTNRFNNSFSINVLKLSIDKNFSKWSFTVAFSKNGLQVNPNTILLKYKMIFSSRLNSWSQMKRKVISIFLSYILKKLVGCSTLVGQRPMKSHSSVCLSVCPSLSFVKIGSLVFSDIVHDDNWPWYLVTDGIRFKKKQVGGPNLDQIDQNWSQN